MKLRVIAAAALTALLLPALPADAALPDPVVQYSDGLTYSIHWMPDDTHVSLSVSGLPSDLTFTDSGNNRGVIAGTAQTAAATYPLTLTATEDDGTQHEEQFNLVVLREDAIVRMAATNPDSVSRRKSFVVKAKVKDTPDRSLGDITKAEPGVFVVEDTRGHLATCPAKIIPGSLDTGAGPDFYEVRCRVAAGLPRGNYRVTYAVAGDYYSGRKSQQVQITR